MKKVSIYFAAALICLAMTNCTPQKKSQIKTMPYPNTAKVDVTDNYHGTLVADPYRWLEDDNSPETAAWVAAQNEVTFDYLSQIPFRDDINQRLTELWNYEKFGVPYKAGDRYFYFYNDGLQNQSALYMMEGLDDPDPKLFLDPNTLSEDGTVALNFVNFSKDGKYLAYGISDSGSDWMEIYTMEIATRKILNDVVRWVKFTAPSWAFDSEGFYYSGYDAPEKGTELSGQNQGQKVFYHKIGTEQSEDILIYADPENPLRYYRAYEQGTDGELLFLEVSEGTSGTKLMYRSSYDKTLRPFMVLFDDFDYEYTVIYAEFDNAYILTNYDAPNYRLVSIKLTDFTLGMRDIIKEDPDRTLTNVSFLGDILIASYMDEASSRIYKYSKYGHLIGSISLPGIGTASGFAGDENSEETFYIFTSYTTAPTVYKYDLKTNESTIFAQPKVNYDPDDYITEQKYFKSKDGTRVPMFISYKKGLDMDGNNPTYMYGYGGFNSPLTPGFNPTNLAIMEQGGIYVVVTLRGGNEYGEEWHKAGMLENKQNVFDDFIAAGEYLIKNKYTSKDKLAIAGGSNGGLLVGACMTQRPDLFAVAIPQVGVLDMLRYHLFTVGWGWVVEYGSSEDPEQFKYIYKYSPLHNIKKGKCYPATLITTADHDDRVVPAHSFKFAAALQEAQKCDNPALIRIDTNAGHGAGKPTSKRIEEATDILSFFFFNTGSEYILPEK